jgi:hypothetical protein
MVIDDDSKLKDEISSIRLAAQGRSIGVFASGHILCRATAQETKDYYHYLVHEKGDWEAAEAAIAKRMAGDTRSLPHARLQALKEHLKMRTCMQLRVDELVDGDAPPEQVQQDPRVERARARRHRHPVERREAHRRVDRPAVADRGQRGAGRRKVVADHAFLRR